MNRKTLLIILSILLCTSALAKPVRPGVRTLTQPDGTTFQAVYYGDEFYRIKTTTSGQAIIQDRDGWWSYAIYNQEGGRTSSGYRVGSATPSEVLSASCNIPYERLRENAKQKRERMLNDGKEPLIRRIMQNSTLATKAADTPITKRGLIILAEFSDVRFGYRKEHFYNMLTQDGYNFNGGTGSARQYFNDQFSNTINFEFEISDIVTLKKSQAYYGANNDIDEDDNPEEMVIEACKAIDSYIDFSKYDEDGDGIIDNVFLFFAGGDEANGAGENCIWSHSWYIHRGAGRTVYLDGKLLDCYACTSELNQDEELTGIGTFCHEYSHTLGLPDLYDTDYDDNGHAAALWLSTSLMDGGNTNNNDNTPPYYNAIEREILGLTIPQVISGDGSYSIEPVYRNCAYRLNTDNDDEYYLFECRDNTGWDKHIGGNGLLVYHIDKSGNYKKRWGDELNTINSEWAHQCADLIEADSRSDKIRQSTGLGDISGVFFPYNKVNSLTPNSTPKLKFWSGKTSKVSINNIRRNDGKITFSVTGYSDETTPPFVSSVRTEKFMDAAIINFESNKPYDGEATVTWGRTGQETQEVLVKPYQSGKYSITLTGLTPGNKTYTVDIHFNKNGVSGKSESISFMTSKESPVSWPYMYLGKNKSQSDGTFAMGAKIALRTYNTSDAESIVWTLNDNEIKPEGDGYFTIKESGILKAHIWWKDGSEDIIEKKINLSETE